VLDPLLVGRDPKGVGDREAQDGGKSEELHSVLTGYDY